MCQYVCANMYMSICMCQYVCANMYVSICMCQYVCVNMFMRKRIRTEVPKLVERYMSGELPIDHYVTHQFDGIEKIGEAMHAMESGTCLRAVLRY